MTLDFRAAAADQDRQHCLKGLELVEDLQAEERYVHEISQGVYVDVCRNSIH
jgi:hypothetical protein